MRSRREETASLASWGDLATTMTLSQRINFSKRMYRSVMQGMKCMMVSQEPMGSYAYIEDSASPTRGVDPGSPCSGNERCGGISKRSILPKNGRSWRPRAGGAHDAICRCAVSKVLGSLILLDSVIRCRIWLWKDAKLW